MDFILAYLFLAEKKEYGDSYKEYLNNNFIIIIMTEFKAGIQGGFDL